jgi:hypothetical protein
VEWVTIDGGGGRVELHGPGGPPVIGHEGLSVSQEGYGTTIRTGLPDDADAEPDRCPPYGHRNLDANDNTQCHADPFVGLAEAVGVLVGVGVTDDERVGVALNVGGGAIALGTTQPSVCAAGIPNGAEVNVALVVRAVNDALNGCPAIEARHRDVQFSDRGRAILSN